MIRGLRGVLCGNGFNGVLSLWVDLDIGVRFILHRDYHVFVVKRCDIRINLSRKTYYSSPSGIKIRDDFIYCVRDLFVFLLFLGFFS